MTQTSFIPDDPLARFTAIHGALNAERGWWSDAACLRFAAMTAVTCPGDPTSVAARIREVAKNIKQQSGWFGELNSPLRFIISALLTANNDSATGFIREVESAGRIFRDAGLRRGGIYETMAILILRMQNGLEPIEQPMVDRFQTIYEQMKKYHWWLTGPDDFPACAILTGQEESAAEIGSQIEQIYQTLHSAGLAKGDPLQTAANILYLAGLPANEVATRFSELASGFRQNGVSIWQSDYDELAILSFLDHAPDIVIERVLQNRREMERLRPKPDRSLTFNLAAGITFLELIRLDRDLSKITDAKAMMDMQAVINAQQAAAAAAASSAAVAASTAASGSS